MKKLIAIFAIILLSVAIFAQGRGGIGTITTDTVQGAETIYLSLGTYSGSYMSLTANVLCTDSFGGTSDGTLTLQGSLDGTSYVFINGAADGNVVTANPKASLTGTDMNQITITPALVAGWVVNGTPYKYFRIAVTGTSGDTTLITGNYMYK